MHCDEARATLSAAADGAAAARERAAFEEHARDCAACAAWQRGVAALRRAVRYEAAGEAPDVASDVLRRLRHRPAPRTRVWARAAAVFAAAALAGAAFVGLDARRPPAVVADVPGRVVAAQTVVETLVADVAVVERGWHADVPERRWSGVLRYRAPEALALHLDDVTGYPGGEWHPADMTLVASGETAWSRALAACPAEALPDCQSPQPRVRAVTGREPFDPSAPAAVELVLPVRSFAGAPAPEPLGSRTVGGRVAVGVATDAAQAGPLLDGLRQAGHWREIYPTDRVELWLDAEVLVPLDVRVLPSSSPDRELWAARRSYVDPPGRPLLEVRLSALRVDAPVGERAFPPPPATEVRDLGFRPGPADGVPAPGWLPEGMRPHRSGTVSTAGGPAIDVASWTDGQAWVKVRATGGWRGGRLFGDLGGAVRPVDLGGGIAYVDERGGSVALHTPHLDVVVAGSVGEHALLRVAASLGLEGRGVPPGWEEAASVPLDDVASDGALLVPALDGFRPPAVRRDGDTTTLAVTGPGARGFVLTQGPGAALSPPLDPDARGVQVRGTAGRYSPSTGELEWVEAGQVVSLRSRTLGLGELVAIADGMVRP